MFTDRQMVSEGNTKHFDGSYSAYIWQNRWSGVVRLSSALSDDNFNWFSSVERKIILIRPICYMFKLNYSAQDVAGRYHNILWSSAYLIILLPGVTVDKSDALMTNNTSKD